MMPVRNGNTMERSDDRRVMIQGSNSACSFEWTEESNSSSRGNSCANSSSRLTWTSAKLGRSGEDCWDRARCPSYGADSSWEWLAVATSAGDEDHNLLAIGNAFAGISVSNFLSGGKVQRGKDRHVTESGWPLIQKAFGQLLGAGSRASSMVKQISLVERAGIGALAGGIAGGFTNVTLHPIDTVKTKLQTKGASQMYSGPLDVVYKVLASQGIAGLYVGVQAAFVGSVMSSSVYFGTYELAKGIFSSIAKWPEALVPPFAAALGNIVSSAILVPKEVVKQRMQAGAAGTTREVFMSTIQNDGVMGLYAGYTAALLRNLPGNIISFSTFEYLKMAWLSGTNKTMLEPWQSVISGATAGALTATLTTPLDLVKTRLMTQARANVSITGLAGTTAEAAAGAQAIAEYTYKGVASTLKRICAEEGPKGLMKGVGTRILYNSLFSAIGFFAFESTRHYLLVKHIERKDAKREKQREAQMSLKPDL